MAFVKKEWKNRISEYPNRRRLTEVEPGVYDVIREEGTVTQEGDMLDAEALNDLEQRIFDELDGISTELDNLGDLIGGE